MASKFEDKPLQGKSVEEAGSLKDLSVKKMQDVKAVSAGLAEETGPFGMVPVCMEHTRNGFEFIVHTLEKWKDDEYSESKKDTNDKTESNGVTAQDTRMVFREELDLVLKMCNRLQNQFLCGIKRLPGYPLEASTVKDSTRETSGGLKGLEPHKSYIVAMGGYNENGEINQRMWYLDDDDNTWYDTPASPSAPGYSACVTPVGVVTTGGISGGRDLQVMCQKHVYVFQRLTRQWSFLGLLQEARYDHSSVYHDDGRLYVLGGVDASHNELSSVEMCNLHTGICTTVAHMPQPAWASVAVSHNKAIYVFGGKHTISEEGRYSAHSLSDVHCLDPKTSTWTYLGTLPQEDPTAAVSYKDKIYVFWEKSLRSYDPPNASWEDLKSLPIRHMGIKSAVIRNGRIIVGGSGESPTKGESAVVDEYDPATNSWKTWELPLPTKLTRHHLVSRHHLVDQACSTGGLSKSAANVM